MEKTKTNGVSSSLTVHPQGKTPAFNYSLVIKIPLTSGKPRAFDFFFLFFFLNAREAALSHVRRLPERNFRGEKKGKHFSEGVVRTINSLSVKVTGRRRQRLRQPRGSPRRKEEEKRLSQLAECCGADSPRPPCHTWDPATRGFVGSICRTGCFRHVSAFFLNSVFL